jgi:5-methyltetrahydrofolate--homocysteine methyltransferase
VQAGADMLDINAGIPLVDEPELLKDMLRTAQEAVDAPICSDSSVIEALEASLSAYEGRALVDSVTAEDERLRRSCRWWRGRRSRNRPRGRGDRSARDDVGADTEAVTTTLTTIRLISDELGVNMCLGASNVSLGLPQRAVLNAAFLPMAMAAGLTSAIMSVAPVCIESVRASDLLLGHDLWGARWIAAHRARQAALAEQEAAARWAVPSVTTTSETTPGCCGWHSGRPRRRAPPHSGRRR